MNTKHGINLKNVAVLAPVLMLFSLAMLTGAVAQTKYSIRDLGTLGGNNSIPIWITNSGDVIGYSETGKSMASATQFSTRLFGGAVSGAITRTRRAMTVGAFSTAT